MTSRDKDAGLSPSMLMPMGAIGTAKIMYRGQFSKQVRA